MTQRSRRAENARRMILDSGDPELIRRLHLLEATAPEAAPPQGNARGRGGAALAAGAGGMIGAVLGGVVLSSMMQSAFAAVAEDLGIDTDGTDLDPEADGADDDGGDGGGFLDDLGLGDFDL